MIIFLCGFSLQLPTIIADNAGYDSADLVAKLRAAHTEGKKTYGLGKHFVTQNLGNCEQCDLFNRNEFARPVTTAEKIAVEHINRVYLRDRRHFDLCPLFPMY